MGESRQAVYADCNAGGAGHGWSRHADRAKRQDDGQSSGLAVNTSFIGFAGGHWTGTNWFWMAGHYVERPYTNAYWVPGHWDSRPYGWTWIPGYWAETGGPS